MDTDVRRLIQFGNSSHIISIPKIWIEENRLKKGDLIYLSKNDNGELILTPKEGSKVKEEKKISINIDDREIGEINREIISAYINNYNHIELKTEKIREKEKIIKELLKDKLGLEITEKTKQSIIISDFLDIGSLSIKKTILRMSNIIKSMLDELKEDISKGLLNKKTYKNLYLADQEINRLYFLVWKIVKKLQEDKEYKIDQKEISNAPIIAINFEYIGDEIKRISKFLINAKLRKEIKNNLIFLLSLIEKNYNSVSKVYFGDEKKSTLEVTKSLEKEIVEECDKIANKSQNIIITKITERLKNVSTLINNTARIISY